MENETKKIDKENGKQEENGKNVDCQANPEEKKDEKKEEIPKEEPIIIPETFDELSEAFVELTKKFRELTKQNTQLKGANDRLMKEYDELNNKYYLLGAELQNKEKVVNKQLEIKTKAYQRSVLSQFFPILESLQLALKNKEKIDALNDPILSSFVSGVESINKNMVSIYENNNVKEIPIEIGKTKFNVTQHEVIYQHVTPDYEDDVILQVSQKGFMIGSDVLRPAKVTVAKNAEKEKERERKANEMRKMREEQRKKEQEERERLRKEEEEKKKKEEEQKEKEEQTNQEQKQENNQTPQPNGEQ